MWISIWILPCPVLQWGFFSAFHSGILSIPLSSFWRVVVWYDAVLIKPLFPSVTNRFTPFSWKLPDSGVGHNLSFLEVNPTPVSFLLYEFIAKWSSLPRWKRKQLHVTETQESRSCQEQRPWLAWIALGGNFNFWSKQNDFISSLMINLFLVLKALFLVNHPT